MRQKQVSGLERFLAMFRPSMSLRELKNVKMAYRLAEYGHAGQKRDSGLPYFEHPRAAAEIIAKELKLKDDWQVIVTVLLHDILEDSQLLDEEMIERLFGQRVTVWVKHLTKRPRRGYIKRLRDYGSWQELLVKLSERLHNLRTLDACTESKRIRQIRETRKDYLPLADLLIRHLPKKSRWRGEYLKKKMEEICASFERRSFEATHP